MIKPIQAGDVFQFTLSHPELDSGSFFIDEIMIPKSRDRMTISIYYLKN